MRLPVLALGFSLVILSVTAAAEQADDVLPAVYSLRYGRRRCRKRCFTGKKSFRRAKKGCPRRSKIQKCISKYRRGFKCLCRSKPKPKPTPPKSTALTVVGGSSTGLTILGCTTTSLFLEVANMTVVAVGNVIWNSPKAGTNACDGCSSVIREVTSMKIESTFGGLSCPAAALCIVVETKLATFGQLFADSLLSLNGLSGAGDLAAESLYGCNLPTSRRLPVTLAESAAIRQLSSVPRDCSDWPQKNSDGRCSFSNCFVGTDGDANDCLECGTMCDNGCGPADNPLLNAAIPDFTLRFDFRDACCSHDHCYSSSFSKEDCDLSFLDSMLNSCTDKFLDFLVLLLPATGILDLNCPEAALLYFSAVSVGGDAAQQSGQEARKAYEMTPKCTAMCPTTQRSGGQGTTTLSVDLMQTSGTFDVSYEMFSIPDGLEVFYEGNTIFSTGGLVSGSRTVPTTYSGNSTVVQVTLSAPNPGTAWTLSVACPPPP